MPATAKTVSRPSQPAAAVKLVKPAFPCEFCNKILSTEKRLLAHLCVPKRRALQRGERYVNIGFHAYQQFWAKRMNPRRVPGWDDFDKSTLYQAFVRFGRYILDINAINPPGFVDFLLRAEIGLDHWCTNSHYQLYMREMIKLESPWEAMLRNMLLMQHWAIEQREPWTDFFRKVAPAQAVLWILSGRLSPWVLFTAVSAGDLLARFSPEQRTMIASAIDDGFWQIKLERHADEVAEIIATLKEYHI